MMMQRLMAMALVGSIAASTVASTGCGTVLNEKVVTVMPPPGGMIDGVPGPMRVTQQSTHIVTYPNGSQCMIATGVGVGYLVADIVLLFLLGVIVDAVTGDWYVLDAASCPGVMISG